MIATIAAVPNLVPLRGAEAAAAVPAGPKAGLVVDLTWGISQGDVDRSVAQIVDSGATWVRMNVNWKDVEPWPNTMNPWWLSAIDYATGQLSAKGIHVLMPIADGVPYWASADPGKYTDAAGTQHWNQYWRPTNNGDYATFAATIVKRYAPMGVHAYEIWNEPNSVRFWPSGPQAADYVGMLKAAYPPIKAADPSAVVVLGGLSTNDYTYLSAIYATGGGRYFDVAAVHPYSANTSPTVCWTDAGTAMNAAGAFCGIATVHQTMVNHGDRAKPIWLTEFGWSTGTCAGGVSEAIQANYLTLAFARLASYPYVTAAFVYNMRNNWWSNNNPADVEANYGLLRTDFSQKPSYAAFKGYARSAPR